MSSDQAPLSNQGEPPVTRRLEWVEYQDDVLLAGGCDCDPEDDS